MSENKIETKHYDYDDIVEHYRNSDLLMGGSIAMRKHSKYTIPQNQHESDEQYRSRVNRSVLFNAYKTTHDTLTKKPFSQPSKWSGELPEKLKFVQTNIDGAGTNQDYFLQKCVSTHLTKGKHAVIVNMPNLFNENGKKVSEIERVSLELNPYASVIDPSSLISWFYGDNKSLEMLKIEYKVENLNGYEVEEVEKIDYWTTEFKQTWVKYKDQEEYALESESDNTLGKIAVIIADDIYEIPALENLAELNLLHYSKQSDKDNNINMALTPFLSFKGWDKKDVEAKLSVHKAYVNEDNDSSIDWVEIQGEGINVALNDLQQLESKMNSYGLDLITQKQVQKTATEKVIDSTDKMSVLQSIVVSVESTSSKVLTLMSEWLNIPDPKLQLEIFKDFNISAKTREEIKDFLSMFDRDLISKERFIKEVERRGLYSKDFVFQDEINSLPEPLEIFK